MAKKSKTVNEVSHEEINDALARFLKKGGVIKKVEYNDNGFLLNNDLALDDNYAEASDSVISQLNVDFEPENRIWFKICPHFKQTGRIVKYPSPLLKIIFSLDFQISVSVGKYFADKLLLINESLRHEFCQIERLFDFFQMFLKSQLLS